MICSKLLVKSFLLSHSLSLYLLTISRKLLPMIFLLSHSQFVYNMSETSVKDFPLLFHLYLLTIGRKHLSRIFFTSIPQSSFIFHLYDQTFHRFGTDGSMRACHAACPGLIPSRDVSWVKFLGVFITYKTNVRAC